MQQFLLQNNSAYHQWREQKLCGYPNTADQLIVHINNPYQLTVEEKDRLLQICNKTNLVIYRISNNNFEDKKIVNAIAMQLGLQHMDNNLCADQDRISSIQVMDEGLSNAYIPYTNKPLNWHTDGYYNQNEKRIRSFLMHCVRPASSGGLNTYLDPELIYILLRDEDPKYIEALQDTSAMTIPPNFEGSEEIRSEKNGPVFLLDDETQSLYMRYTARSRNIIWKDNAATKRAQSVLLDILKKNHYQFRYCLQKGEGVICNNVLHNRTMFIDNPKSKRLLYRARFYDRVSKPDHIDDLKVSANQCYG